jgi:hypothetical protein
MELFFRGALAATIFLAKHVMSKEEVDALIKKGEEVTYSSKTFSIYHDGPTEFKIEDCLIENCTFEWQQYKVQRMMDRIIKKEQKDNLKEEASLSAEKKEELPLPDAEFYQKI